MRLTFRQTHLYRLVNMAERVGFEPTEPCGSTDFELELGFGTLAEIAELSGQWRTPKK